MTRLALLIAATALAGCGESFIKKDAGGCRMVETGDGSRVEVCESAPREACTGPPPVRQRCEQKAPPEADGGKGAGQGQGSGQ